MGGGSVEVVGKTYHIWKTHDGQLDGPLTSSLFFLCFQLLLVEAAVFIQDRLQSCIQFSHAFSCMQRNPAGQPCK